MNFKFAVEPEHKGARCDARSAVCDPVIRNTGTAYNTEATSVTGVDGISLTTFIHKF
jgi:hypothetical protein